MGLGFIGLVSVQIIPANLPWLAPAIGASAVLLFAVPSSPLSQPWPIIGGNAASAMIGIGIGSIIREPIIAGAIAVSVAVLTMSLLRCLHAPGGAIALGAVSGGHDLMTGFQTYTVPVVLGSVLLVFIGRVFHRYSGHSYPHRSVVVVREAGVPVAQPGFIIEDIDRALLDLGETFDVSREDLALLFAQAEAHADERKASRASLSTDSGHQ